MAPMPVGDAGPDSDLDVLVIGDKDPNRPWVPDVGESLNNLSISRYSWSEIRGMASYGSLFLHHLRLEGRPIFEDQECRGRLRRLLDELPEYAKGSRDVKGFGTVLRDVGAELTRRCDDPYELSVLGTIIRHSAILGCWLLGIPQFGRTKPVHVIAEAIGSEADWGAFRELYQYRLYCDRRIGKGRLSAVDWGIWWARAHEIVYHLETNVNDDSEKMSTRDSIS